MLCSPTTMSNNDIMNNVEALEAHLAKLRAEAAERESWVVRVKGLRDSSLEVVV